MPIVTLKDDRFLQFEDSGAPSSSSSYSTIFLIHGFIFYSPSFRPMFPHAAAHNLRLISITVPGYPGSYPLTDGQVSALNSTDAEEAAFAFQKLSSDIASAIARIITDERLPAPHNGEGGVAILAWSAGNAFLLSILGNPAALDEGVHATLQQHITTCIIHDAPCLALGIPKPPEAYSPIEDPSLSPADIAARFVVWAASYFAPFPDLESVTPAALAHQENLSASAASDSKYAPIVSMISEEQVAGMTYLAVLGRSPTPLTQTTLPGVYAPNLRKALLETNGAWPNVRVLVLWTDMGIMYCPWGAKVLSGMMEESAVEGQQRRDVDLLLLKSANHFVHWEDPNRMLRILAERMRNSNTF